MADIMLMFMIVVARGHHSISKGGGGGEGVFMYFNPARRGAENVKFYYMFI